MCLLCRNMRLRAFRRVDIVLSTSAFIFSSRGQSATGSGSHYMRHVATVSNHIQNKQVLHTSVDRPPAVRFGTQHLVKQFTGGNSLSLCHCGACMANHNVAAQRIVTRTQAEVGGEHSLGVCSDRGDSMRHASLNPHRMTPVACRPIIKCGKSGCTGSCPLSVLEYGYKVGKKPATCRTCGKTFPRPNVTLSDFFPAPNERKKENRSRNSSPGMSRRSSNVSPAMPRKSSVVSWSDSPRELSEANGEDTVMEDGGTETHQAEINKKIKANDKLRNKFTNMPEEHRSLIYGDSFKSRMESLDDEKAALLVAKRQSLPLQSRIDRQKNLVRVSKEIESNKNGSRLIRNWEQPTVNRYKPNKRRRCWWLNSLQKMQQLSIKGNQGFSLACQDPSLIKLHNTPFSQCSNPFSRCKAWGVTAFRNSSWQLAQPRRMFTKSARLWHRLCGHWRQGSRILNLDPKRTASRAKWWAQMKSSPMECAYPVTAKWTPKNKKPSSGVCQMPSEKRDDWRRNANRKVKVCSLLRLWIWIQLTAVPFYLSLSRIGEADNPGPAHATAKLFDVQFEAIGQWAANLTSKSEMELTPLLAQLGKMQTNVQRELRERDPSLHLIGQSEHPRHSQSYGLSPPAGCH